jgi:hypothetical protein
MEIRGFRVVISEVFILGGAFMSRHLLVAASLALAVTVSTFSACCKDCTTANRTDAKANDGFKPLFNGKNFDGFYTYLETSKKNSDPSHIFKVENGMIHIMDLAESTATQETGYLATEKTYANFHLRLQYKWGTKRWAPRATLPRDSGIHYLFNGEDKIWENAMECQIQEHDTGDLYNLNGTYVIQTTVKDPAARPMVFSQTGTPTQLVGNRMIKGEEADSLTDWNTVEVIVKGNTSTHIVNGKIVAHMTGIKNKDGTPATEGRIALQSEAAEMWYRNIEIKMLK